MKGLCVIILVMFSFVEVRDSSEEIKNALKNINATKALFTLPAADLAMLDELNTMRSVIAEGVINKPLEKLGQLLLKGGLVFVSKIGEAANAMLKASAENLKKFGLQMFSAAEQVIGDFGNYAVSTQKALNDIGEGLGNTFEKGVSAVGSVVKGAGNAIGSMLGKKRRNVEKKRNKRFFDKIRKSIVDTVEFIGKIFTKPENVFGPAKDMNMFTWNRRLAQLAMVEKKNIESKGVTVIHYEGKLYRVTKYGTLATYVIATTLGEFISQIFKVVRIAYLVCKLWFETFEIPKQSESDTIHKTHEMLFADRIEVGCFYTWPDTICIVGPLKAVNKSLYDAGEVGESCKYGVTNSLCNPSPEYFFAIREKYKKYLRPKIEKFEIVGGFDGEKPIVGKNFMIDSSHFSNGLMISILVISLVVLFRNTL